MSGSPKQRLETQTTEEAGEEKEQELYLRDGRKVVIRDQLVEIRSESGMVEVRIQMTEQGPVLQMETVRMKLAASEVVEIESPRVAITGTEQLQLEGGKVQIEGEEGIDVESEGDVRVVGKMIYLN
jgi:hypothetical protein